MTWKLRYQEERKRAATQFSPPNEGDSAHSRLNIRNHHQGAELTSSPTVGCFLSSVNSRSYGNSSLDFLPGCEDCVGTER
jgi:hypothetical protein